MYNALASAARAIARTDGFVATPEVRLVVHRSSLPGPPAIREIEPRFTAVLQGCKRIRVGGRVEDMRVGSYAVITRPAAIGTGVARAAPHAPYLAIVLRLDPARLASAIGAGDAVPAAPITASSLDDALCLRLRTLLEAPTPANERALLAALAATQYGPALRGFAARALDPLVAAALAWLESHVDAPLSIEHVARAIGASTSSLHHRFKHATGTTPGKHHKRLRLDRARELLALGDMPAREVAGRVGYASMAQFIRDYRRAFAITPGRDARVQEKRPG